jgi:hypothetical protein
VAVGRTRELDLSALAAVTHDEDVLRLHVAVHDPGVVHVVNALEYLEHERLACVLAQRLLLALYDDVVQVVVAVLEHERQRLLAWVHVHVVQVHHVVVVQLAQQLDLANRRAGQHYVVLALLVRLDQLDSERHGLLVLCGRPRAGPTAAAVAARAGRPRQQRR